jgi:hypothetical protein
MEQNSIFSGSSSEDCLCSQQSSYCRPWGEGSFQSHKSTVFAARVEASLSTRNRPTCSPLLLPFIPAAWCLSIPLRHPETWTSTTAPHRGVYKGRKSSAKAKFVSTDHHVSVGLHAPSCAPLQRAQLSKGRSTCTSCREKPKRNITNFSYSHQPFHDDNNSSCSYIEPGGSVLEARRNRLQASRVLFQVTQMHV